MLERVIFDAETHWSTEYTLKKMTTLEYVQDPRFELQCGVICRESASFKPAFHRGPQLEWILQNDINWSNTELICHNMHFDGLMLAIRYGIIPARYTCTLSYSRYHYKGATFHGLDELAKFLGIEGKRGDLSKITKGKRLAEFTPEIWQQAEEYTVQDGRLGTYVWLHLQKFVPEHERIIQDMTFRMATQPRLLLNQELVTEAIQEAKDKRDNALGIYDIKMLRSREKFANALRELGIEPPTKLNKEGKTTYAFAKKDEDFIELLEHHDERVRDLVEAKLASSSNIDLTRAQRFAAMGEKCIVTLQPSGAETDRWSGSGGTNLQNLRRGSRLRRAITAPKGFVIFAPDQAQIEARINAAVSDCIQLVNAFKQGRDVYSEFGTDAFGYPVNRKIRLPDGTKPFETEGFVGKTCILGLGYQTGGPKLQHTLATSEKRLKISLDRAYELVNLYRRKYWQIPLNWERQEENMRRMCGNGDPFTWKWMEFRPREKRVYWPDGSSLLYTDLHVNEDNRMVYWRATRGWTDIYGGKSVEHHCQKTGNSIIKQNALDIYRELDLPMLNTTHDEMMFLLPETEAERYAARILQIMCTPKDWFSEIPVSAEGEYGPYYAK